MNAAELDRFADAMNAAVADVATGHGATADLSLIHISEPTRPY